MNFKKFPGNPVFYRKLAAGLGVISVGSVYLLFSMVKYFLYEETWMFEVRSLAIVAGLIGSFILLAYLCFMQLDGQFLGKRHMEEYREKNIIPFP